MSEPLPEQPTRATISASVHSVIPNKVGVFDEVVFKTDDHDKGYPVFMAPHGLYVERQQLTLEWSTAAGFLPPPGCYLPFRS